MIRYPKISAVPRDGGEGMASTREGREEGRKEKGRGREGKLLKRGGLDKIWGLTSAWTPSPPQAGQYSIEPEIQRV